MTPSTLKKLTISHLRGSILPFSLSFDEDKKLTIIYGENGAGKSTICDALEFMGKGKVGSIDNRGLGRTGPYWPSLGKKPGDVSVTLETQAGNCCATINKNVVLVSSPEHRPRVEVLRRAQILDLVAADPAARYTEIRRFIDVSQIEACEESLRNSIKNVRNDQTIALARIQENQQALEQFWEQAGRPDPNALTWAATESEKDTTDLGTKANALDQLRLSYGSLKAYPQRLADAEQALAIAQQALAAAQTELAECIQGMTAEAPGVVRVLEAARTFLSQYPNPGTCPLCESKENLVGLAKRVDDKLSAFKMLRDAQTKKQNAETAVQRATERIAALIQEASKSREQFDKSKAQTSLPKDTAYPPETLPQDISAWDAWLTATDDTQREWEKSASNLRDRTKFIGTLKMALNTYRENIVKAKDLVDLLPRLEKILEIVGEERHKFTDSALAGIASEVGRLYESVHPGEGLNKISMALVPGKRASLDIEADFMGVPGAPPQAYFSDSHLDTLGLCVFLALASLDKPEETLLVLDDILGSVDEPHVERLIEMLYQQALNFRHCIITTHYRPWKEKLRWGWLQNGQCFFVELTKWTSQKGITAIRSTPDVERLRLLLGESPPDRQLVCAKAGVILEALLDFLTQQYQCEVPRRPGNLFTLGDLLKAMDKKLRNALAVEVLTRKEPGGAGVYYSIQLGPILDELRRVAEARNIIGCHFNTISFELLDEDALGFGQAVLNLAEALTDKDTGWPKNGKSGSYWATSGETRRLHPYARPS